MKDKETAISIIHGIMGAFEISIKEIYNDEKTYLVIVPKENKND